MAEVELAAPSRECLNRRLGSMAELCVAVEAWEDARNAGLVEAKWQFTTADARVRLRRFYPSVQ